MREVGARGAPPSGIYPSTTRKQTTRLEEDGSTIPLVVSFLSLAKGEPLGEDLPRIAPWL